MAIDVRVPWGYDTAGLRSFIEASDTGAEV
jgi:hypothetical protein